MKGFEDNSFKLLQTSRGLLLFNIFHTSILRCDNITVEEKEEIVYEGIKLMVSTRAIPENIYQWFLLCRRY